MCQDVFLINAFPCRMALTDLHVFFENLGFHMQTNAGAKQRVSYSSAWAWKATLQNLKSPQSLKIRSSSASQTTRTMRPAWVSWRTQTASSTWWRPARRSCLSQRMAKAIWETPQKLLEMLRKLQSPQSSQPRQRKKSQHACFYRLASAFARKLQSGEGVCSRRSQQQSRRSL